MQGHDAYLDRSANSQSAHDNGSTATTVGTAVSALEPYVPPNVPHGLPHVVRYATLSSMDLPLEVRFLIIIIARFANVHGVASVANSTLRLSRPFRRLVGRLTKTASLPPLSTPQNPISTQPSLSGCRTS